MSRRAGVFKNPLTQALHRRGESRHDPGWASDPDAAAQNRAADGRRKRLSAAEPLWRAIVNVATKANAEKKQRRNRRLSRASASAWRKPTARA